MHLEYNGVHLELLSLDRVERENVYDPSRTDLLYVRWLISATCVYSPGGRFPVATAVTTILPDTAAQLTGATVLPGDRGVRGVFRSTPRPLQEENTEDTERGFNALVTDVELRTRLCLPRRELVIWAFGADGKKLIWLQAPKAGYVCDPINGPRPLGPPDVVDITGEGTTFGVHFQVECATLPNPDASDQLILSHRWQMDHDHDDDFYLTRVIDGEIVFNAALLASLNLNADWFRSQFFHPIPLGFQRLGPKVSISPDGNVIKYRVVDRDTAVVFDAGDSGATQMHIVEKLSYDQPWRIV